MEKLLIAPSIYAANLLELKGVINRLEAAGADLLHVDVMDGHFVRLMAFGTEHIKSLAAETTLPLDVHLMIERPERMIDDFAAAGASIITIHQESTTQLLWCLQHIHNLGIKAGVALAPATPGCVIGPLLDYIDQILVMTVNPGQTGQHFLTSTMVKLARIRNMIGKRAIDLEVDGDINNETIRIAHEHGANVFVSGKYLMHSIEYNMAVLRTAIA
jgi:ribulose-phosphate 3-epimerase